MSNEMFQEDINNIDEKTLVIISKGSLENTRVYMGKECVGLLQGFSFDAFLGEPAKIEMVDEVGTNGHIDSIKTHDATAGHVSACFKFPTHDVCQYVSSSVYKTLAERIDKIKSSFPFARISGFFKG